MASFFEGNKKGSEANEAWKDGGREKPGVGCWKGREDMNDKAWKDGGGQ